MKLKVSSHEVVVEFSEAQLFIKLTVVTVLTWYFNETAKNAWNLEFV